jgi:hypothetical protein
MAMLKERLEEEENCKTCATERDIVGGASRWELWKLDVDAGWQSGSAPNAVGLPCQDCPAGACRWTNRVERATCVLVRSFWALYDGGTDKHTYLRGSIKQTIHLQTTASYKAHVRWASDHWFARLRLGLLLHRMRGQVQQTSPSDTLFVLLGVHFHSISF